MAVSSKIVGAIGVAVVVIVLLAMTDVVIDQVQLTVPQGGYPSAPVNTTWNFTGDDGAESILGLIPFVWIAAVLVAGAAGMFAISKES